MFLYLFFWFYVIICLHVRDYMKRVLILIMLLCVFLSGCSYHDVVSKDNSLIKEDTKSNLNEGEFVNYMEDVNDSVDSILEKERLSSGDKETLKDTFIKITDFIFYDGEIKGKKFSDLTNEAKSKVLSIYEKMDSRIEEKFPNYKDTIKEKGKNTYSNVKKKVLDLKEKILMEYKESVGDENFKYTEEDFDTDKENLKEVYEEYKPYIESGKEKVVDEAGKVREKVSSWYKEYKES